MREIVLRPLFFVDEPDANPPKREMSCVLPVLVRSFDTILRNIVIVGGKKGKLNLLCSGCRSMPPRKNTRDVRHDA